MGFVDNLILFLRCKNCENWFTFDNIITDYVMSRFLSGLCQFELVF